MCCIKRNLKIYIRINPSLLSGFWVEKLWERKKKSTRSFFSRDRYETLTSLVPASVFHKRAGNKINSHTMRQCSRKDSCPWPGLFTSDFLSLFIYLFILKWMRSKLTYDTEWWEEQRMSLWTIFTLATTTMWGIEVCTGVTHTSQSCTIHNGQHKASSRRPSKLDSRGFYDEIGCVFATEVRHTGGAAFTPCPTNSFQGKHKRSTLETENVIVLRCAWWKQ